MQSCQYYLTAAAAAKAVESLTVDVEYCCQHARRQSRHSNNTLQRPTVLDRPRPVVDRRPLRAVDQTAKPDAETDTGHDRQAPGQRTGRCEVSPTVNHQLDVRRRTAAQH